MSMKNIQDKAYDALENGKTKTLKAYDFMNSLSLKNKASFDCQLKSSKKLRPLWRLNLGYDKEIKILPILYVAVSLITVFCMLCSMCHSKDN